MRFNLPQPGVSIIRAAPQAAHCFAPNENPSISFAPIAGSGTGITSFFRNTGFNATILENDVAVISLAQPVTNVAPVKLLMLQQGQAGFPTTGTTITMVGYGANGTGSEPPTRAIAGLDPPPGVNIGEPIDNKRRNGMSSLVGYDQLFFSQFRDPSRSLHRLSRQVLQGATVAARCSL